MSVHYRDREPAGALAALAASLAVCGEGVRNG